MKLISMIIHVYFTLLSIPIYCQYAYSNYVRVIFDLSLPYFVPLEVSTFHFTSWCIYWYSLLFAHDQTNVNHFLTSSIHCDFKQSNMN